MRYWINDDAPLTAEEVTALRTSRPSLYVDYLLQRGWAWSDALTKALATLDQGLGIDVERLAVVLHQREIGCIGFCDPRDDGLMVRPHGQDRHRERAAEIAREYAALSPATEESRDG